TGSDAASTASGDLWGVDPARFGVAPAGSKVAKNGLILTAPALLEVRVPTDLVAGRQFVARAQLYGDAEGQASAQVRASFEKPAAGGVTTPGEAKEINADESWSTRSRHVVHSAPILVSPGGP